MKSVHFPEIAMLGETTQVVEFSEVFWAAYLDEQMSSLDKPFSLSERTSENQQQGGVGSHQLDMSSHPCPCPFLIQNSCAGM